MMINRFISFTLYLLACCSLSWCSSGIDSDDFGFYQCTKPGLFAMTFDDGPSLNGNTEKVLDVLRKKRVRATFFVTGAIDSTSLENDPRKQNLIRRAFSEGHQIGSHTWSHHNLTQNMSRQEIVNDIRHLSKTISNILGGTMTVFRAPYGSTNKTVISLIRQEFNYSVVAWNLDTKDWYNGKNILASINVYNRKISTGCPLKDSFISLHHDYVSRSWELAVKAIDYVRTKGFKLVTVGECIGVPVFTYF